MRANCIEDGRLVWRDMPDPTPGDREVLIKVAAAGVNAADILQLRGHYPAPEGAAADIPGLELAGSVVAVGASVR
ncbi:MAG: alcohol dehydrogenase catalytic domain-containing protein, partial [Candidatus Dormibacteria bacterium]